MDNPEARAPLAPPWLFGRRGIAILGLVTLLAATVATPDVAYLAACLFLAGLLARAWAAAAFERVTYARRPLTSRVFCGDELIVESSLVNAKPLPMPWVEVWEQLPLALAAEEQVERSLDDPRRGWLRRGLSIGPYRRVRWRRRFVCSRRGAYHLGDTWLRGGDPFGLFEDQRQVSLTDATEVVVYPHVVALRRLGLPLHHPSLDAASPRSPVADPTRTATVRDYRPDDPRRLIHWPTTARRGALQVRVLEPATSLRVSLVLDLRAFVLGIYRDQLLELAISALASIAVYLHAQGQPTALLANARPPLVLAPGTSLDHLQHLLESLSRMETQAGPALLPWIMADLPRGSSVILASSDVAPDLQLTIGHLEASGCSVLPLLAGSRAAGRRGRAIHLSPGCDLAATLEGGA
jgi:uncharacterized protein (DUF58 family)